MIKVDFHIHSNYSPDSLNTINDIINISKLKNINKIAITDHNTIKGALIAKDIDENRIIIGEEIMTQAGEVLGFFLSDEIPAGLPLRTTIELLKKQNAFISIPHPFDKQRHGLGAANIRDIINDIDAIEAFNARCVKHKYNQESYKFATQNNLAQTIGSDAHTNQEIGNATLSLPDFNSSNELRKVIKSGKPEVMYSPKWIHFLSTYAKFRQKP